MYQPVTTGKFRIAGYDEEDTDYTEPVQITCPALHVAVFGEYSDNPETQADLAVLVEWANVHRDCERRKP